MSTAVATGGPAALMAPTRDDRLHALFAPAGAMPRFTLAVLAGSVAFHLIVVTTAIVTSRAPLVSPEPQATTVEVVHELPKSIAAPKPVPEALKPPAPAKTEARKADAPRKVDAAKVEIPKIEAAKTEAPKPASMQAVAQEREALLKELAALRAQEAKLETRQAAPANLGMGPLPESFQAVALPSSTEGAGEAMGYKELVFSQLAKAKGLDERMGLPGTAGVRFEIDADGGLVRAEIVHPSGVAALDREALDIVRRAAPFPAPPQGAQRNFTANVSFVTQGKP